MTIPTATNTPAWDGAERIRDCDGDEWVRVSDGDYAPLGGATVDWIESNCGPCTVVESAPDADEPRKAKVANCARCDRIEAHSIGNEALLARRREQLAKAKDEIDRLEARITELEADKPEEPKYGDGDLPYGLTVAEDGSYLDWLGEHYTRSSDIAVKPEPGPWLTGDELEVTLPTLKAGDVVEVEYRGRKASGELYSASSGGLMLWKLTVRLGDGDIGTWVHALRIIERAPEPEPEPGADIPDEVVEAALAAIPWASDQQLVDVRAALAAADAKRAELAGGEQA